MAGIAGGDNLKNPIRSPGTTPVSEFVPVTDHTYVRLDYVFAFLQLGSEWGWIDAAGVPL